MHLRWSTLGAVTASACLGAIVAVAGVTVVLTAAPDLAHRLTAAAGTSGSASVPVVLKDEATSTLPPSFDRAHVRASAQTDDDIRPLARSVAVGDHLTVGDNAGLKRVLVVKKVLRRSLSIENGAKSEVLPIAIVEARDAGQPSAAPVRLIIEDRIAKGDGDARGDSMPRAL